MIILDGNRMEDRAALHAELKAKLNLPEYYGGNLDALNDCLSELPERGLIAIHRFGDFSEALGPYAMKLLQVFTDNDWQVLLD